MNAVATSEEELLAQEAALDGPSPVLISGEAHKHYASMFRMWSGWDEAGILFDDPMPYSQWAYTDHDTQTVVLDPDNLILNPNRLLLTMTPYRMKQEAVLTGTVLHEAGHARFTRWTPLSTDSPKVQQRKLLHSKKYKNEPVTKQTFALAHLMEEPRIEGLMARDAMKIGAVGLGWTMRAAAAHLIPRTVLSEDPKQRVMDLITAWAYRAGRHLAVNNWIRSHALNRWVDDMTEMTTSEIGNHLSMLAMRGAQTSPLVDAQKIMSLLMGLLWSEDHDGKTMVDVSREVLELLYPETDDDSDDPSDQPQPGGGCHSQPQEGDDEGKAQGSGERPADQDDLQKALDDASGKANQDSGQTEEEAKAESKAGQQSPQGQDSDEQGMAGGRSSIDKITGRFRAPDAEEREIEKGAQRFLRSLINPTTTTKMSLSSSPSSSIDAKAFSAWKASGQMSEPRFFRRIKRTTKAAPPVKIAVLVDVSSSMESLQAPSALLSWALASAAIDLRNFAGRGVQIESTLIHWGDTSEVIQKPGQWLPGIREVACNQGTSAMHMAFDQIEDQIPGFFEEGDPSKPVSRLIVQFTDWDLYGRCTTEMVPRMSKALANGVNHLSVFPNTYSENRSDLDRITTQAKIQRGRNLKMTYNPKMPGQIWDTATDLLG